MSEKFEPAVNWVSHIEMKESDQYGRPQVVAEFLLSENGEDSSTIGVCSAAPEVQGPAAYSPKIGLFYVPINHVCMDCELFHIA